MKLTYRGVQYSEKSEQLSTSTSKIRKKEIIYRGNSPQAIIKPQFPWLKYIRQLFKTSETQPIFDPITFWYNHKRQFLEDIWRSDDTEKLDRAWNLTLQIEQTTALKAKQKTKLKYRGVTYYR